jgi:hypothetical protein
MASKLVISLASRGRPQQLLETVSRSMANWTNPNTVLNLALDADDQPTLDYLNLAAPHAWFVGPNGPRINLDIRPREDTIAAKWNRALLLPADLYLVAADDDPYVTPGYDQKLLDAADLFHDGIGMVYGHMANLSFSGVIAGTAKWCDILGYLQPEHFPYWFCDHWTDDLAKITNRISFADVRTDQSKAGQTQEMREPAWWATWFDAGYLYRRKEVTKILLHTTDPMSRLLANAPLREHYSKWVNSNVRGMQAPPLPLNDERYQRVKEKAIAMLPQFFDGMNPQEALAYNNALNPPPLIANISQAFPPLAA